MQQEAGGTLLVSGRHTRDVSTTVRWAAGRASNPEPTKDFNSNRNPSLIAAGGGIGE